MIPLPLEQFGKYKPHASFAIAFVGSVALGISGNPLAYFLAAFIAALAALYHFAPKFNYSFLKKWKRPEHLTYIMGGILAAAFLGYLAFPSPILAFIAFLALAVLFLEDLIPKQAGTKGVQSAILETASALALALVGWFVVVLLLQTQYPLDVVTSCSMRPHMERGDLIILQGGSVRAPEFTMNANVGDAWFRSETALVNFQPVQYYSLYDLNKQVFASSFAQCTWDGAPVPCADSVTVEGQIIAATDLGNDVIVYDSGEAGLGLIIHRVVAKINAKDGTFYLTKGDNNRFLDQQTGRIHAVPEEAVHGKVLLRVPYVGFLKLFLFLQLEAPPGCDALLEAA